MAEAAAEAGAAAGRCAIVCGKGNNGGDGLVAARLLREMGFEVEALLLSPADELSADAAANLERFDGARQVDAGELGAALRGLGRGRRRDLRHRLRGRAARPGGGGDRGDQRAAARRSSPADIASGVDASTGEVAGRGGRGRRHGHLPRAPSSATGSRPASAHTGELRVAPIGIPDGAPGRAAARR